MTQSPSGAQCAQSRYLLEVECTFADLRECLFAMSFVAGDIALVDHEARVMSALRDAMLNRLSLAERELDLLEKQIKQGRAA
ncbi:hypothetical protein SAMN04515647_4404 [Cohaesibacter sp. ES.047]|uniref:hypothetical protein n=1 Tax=Cohaesibacter sp. ES.047 TaxID=1798205 RepID=UPI000BB6EB3F|nr:hypothetical protein [Cohaesibacter sp. ES.047]SNY94081.1 hypothetical protein SAMN04515647_4404 [Cohaesibacter sp. ES.047]